MKISVIMLTYNREAYIGNMIQDILNQTYSDFEYIIVDNGSSDQSGTIADRYAERDKRIRVIHLDKPVSIGHGRNIGLSNAMGEYIAFVDDDDRVKNDFLEFLLDLIEDNNADISMCGTTEGDGTTRNPQCLFDEKMILTGEEALRLLLGRKYIRAGIPAKLYKREMLEKYPFEEKYKNEDIHTQYKYLLESKTVVIHGVDKYYITRHADNVSGFTSNAGMWDARTMSDYLHAFHNRTEYVRQMAPNSYQLALYAEWSFMISMVEKIERFQIEDCRKIQQVLIEILRVNRTAFLNMQEIQDFEREWMEKYVKNGS